MSPHKASNIVITVAVMSTVISITITLSSFFIANSMAIARRVTETSFGIWKKIIYVPLCYSHLSKAELLQEGIFFSHSISHCLKLNMIEEK